MNLPFLNRVSSIKPLFDYLAKQQENRKFIKSVEISATFFLITFFLYFAVRPTFLAISALNGQIESKKILKNELKTKINDVIKAQDLFSLVQERYQVMNTSLPDRPSYFEAANQLQKTGVGSSITVDNLLYDFNEENDKQVDPNTRFYSISLGLKGSYLSSLGMVSELLNNRRLINVNNIRFNSDSGDNSSSPSAAGTATRFSATFYYWPNPNEKK